MEKCIGISTFFIWPTIETKQNKNNPPKTPHQKKPTKKMSKPQNQQMQSNNSVSLCPLYHLYFVVALLILTELLVIYITLRTSGQTNCYILFSFPGTQMFDLHCSIHEDVT